MNDPPSEPLSEVGQARREAMLDELVAVLNQTHRARRLRRRVLGTGVVVCLVLLLMRIGWPGAGGLDDGRLLVDRTPDERRVVMPTEAPRRSGCVIVLVKTDPTVVDRYRARTTGLAVRMDDRMLLNALASINRPKTVPLAVTLAPGRRRDSTQFKNSFSSAAIICMGVAVGVLKVLLPPVTGVQVPFRNSWCTSCTVICSVS